MIVGNFMSLLFFLVQVFVISLSGAMQPGPVTAAAITMGARNRYAGVLLTIGHIIIEFPLIILIILGIGVLLKSTNVRIVIGLAGGMVLLVMAVQMFIASRTEKNAQTKIVKDKPILTGLILSVSNPYFLLWWATVGLALATKAEQFGICAFAMFAAAHWLCDLAWISALSWTSFKGSRLLGPRGRQIIPLICSAALFAFGLFFIYNAVSTLVNPL